MRRRLVNDRDRIDGFLAGLMNAMKTHLRRIQQPACIKTFITMSRSPVSRTRSRLCRRIPDVWSCRPIVEPVAVIGTFAVLFAPGLSAHITSLLTCVFSTHDAATPQVRLEIDPDSEIFTGAARRRSEHSGLSGHRRASALSGFF